MDPRIESYLKRSRDAGKPDSQIAKELAGAGWPRKEIEKILSCYNNPENNVFSQKNTEEKGSGATIFGFLIIILLAAAALSAYKGGYVPWMMEDIQGRAVADGSENLAYTARSLPTEYELREATLSDIDEIFASMNIDGLYPRWETHSQAYISGNRQKKFEFRATNADETMPVSTAMNSRLSSIVYADTSAMKIVKCDIIGRKRCDEGTETRETIISSMAKTGKTYTDEEIGNIISYNYPSKGLDDVRSQIKLGSALKFFGTKEFLGENNKCYKRNTDSILLVEYACTNPQGYPSLYITLSFGNGGKTISLIAFSNYHKLNEDEEKFASHEPRSNDMRIAKSGGSLGDTIWVDADDERFIAQEFSKATGSTKEEALENMYQ